MDKSIEIAPFPFSTVEAPQGKIKSRITGFGYCKVKDLMDNPSNWREHTVRQGEAVKESIRGIGWVEPLIVNTRSGKGWKAGEMPVILNGHLRKKLTKEIGDEYAPVIFLDLDPEEENFVLATLDPLASLAVNNQDKLNAIVAQAKNLETALKAALRGAGLDPRTQLTTSAAPPVVEEEATGLEKSPGGNGTGSQAKTQATVSMPSDRAKFPLAIVLDGREYHEWTTFKQTNELRSDTEALIYLMNLAKGLEP